MKRAFAAVAGVVCALAVARPASASDHIDTPANPRDLATDITDLFAFTPPGQTGKLVLVMDVNPQASSKSRFSDAAVYSFRVRPDHYNTKELRIDCTFDTETTQNMACNLYAFETATGKVLSKAVLGPIPTGSTTEPSKGGLRGFAGLRVDPFFLDVGLQPTLMTGKFVFVGKNSVDKFNVLAIALEVDLQQHLQLGDSKVVRVTGQTTRKKAAQ